MQIACPAEVGVPELGGETVQAGVFGGADLVFDPGMLAVAGIEQLV
jgi:hypothetical protein